MKKRIEGELISIAHRILKLKDKDDVIKLQNEAKNLYEQLTLLRFYEENIALVEQEISKENFETKIGKNIVGTIDIEDDDEIQIASPENVDIIKQSLFEQTPTLDNDLINHAQEETKGLTSKNNIISIEAELMDSIPEINKPINTVEGQAKVRDEIIGTKVNKQISIEELLVHDYQETVFSKKDETSSLESVNQVSQTVISELTEQVIKPKESDLATEKKVSAISSEGNPLAISLNDRIAFEKNLFNGNSDDLNRVLSQLNTFSSLTEAKSFLLDFVKPDYNNWQGKEAFERMFLDIIENKFK